jgi:DNA-binding NarL/FixJ family response regulator
LRNKEIAGDLNISEETVQGHVKKILKKLNVNDRTKAAMVAAQRGIFHISKD